MKARLFGVCVMLICFVWMGSDGYAAEVRRMGQNARQTVKENFIFVTESAVFNPNTQEVLFTVEFNQSPDLFNTDSFQYFIVGDPNLPYPANFDAIIRGSEIPAQNKIRIRNSVPSDLDPAAGGWGSIRGEVPYSLNGNVLTFSTPLKLITDHCQIGNLAYRLESYQSGALTKYVDSQVIGGVTCAPTPQAQVDTLIAKVQSLITKGVLNNGQGNSLLNKLDQVKEQLAKGNTRQGCKKISDFINEVQKLLNQAKLSAADGNPLLEAANALTGQLCGGVQGSSSGSNTDGRSVFLPLVVR